MSTRNSIVGILIGAGILIMIALAVAAIHNDFSEWKRKKSSGEVLTSLHLGTVELFIAEKEGVKYAVLIGSQCCAICPVPPTPALTFNPTSPGPIGTVDHIPMKELPPLPDTSAQRLFQPR